MALVLTYWLVNRAYLSVKYTIYKSYVEFAKLDCSELNVIESELLVPAFPFLSPEYK